MRDGYAWISLWTVLLVDLSQYGIKEWLAVVGSLFGIGGSIFGLWRAWRYSKSQIAERLLEYLQNEETKINAARERIIRHLRWGDPLGGNIEHHFFHSVADALAISDPHHTERTLDHFAETLAGDLKLAEKFVANTNLQLATLSLVRGKSAKERSETSTARTAWEEAVRRFSQDAEAERYLGELALAEGDIKNARKHFDHAYAHAPDDKMLRAETWEQVAAYYRGQGQPKVELTALVQCALNFSGAEAWARAAVAYARAGELAAQLNFVRRAPDLLRGAFNSYSALNDRDGMKAMRRKLESLEEDVSDLPPVDDERERYIPWRWIRLALELSILAAAGVLFYITVR
jgi:tetratricopeptide (TPR) repeat protein